MKHDFFLGIGAQRAGTTWLSKYCREHPQIGMAFPKELHYFDAVYRPDMCASFNKKFKQEFDAIQEKKTKGLSNYELAYLPFLEQRLNMLNDESLYVSYIQNFALETHKTLGEITPSYSLLTELGFRAIRRLIPRTKFVFILRDPVDRYWSQLRFAQLSRKNPFDATENITEYLQKRQFVLRTDYKRTIEELLKVVSIQDVCILFFEHLVDPERSAAELKRFCDFLEIDFREGNFKQRENSAPEIQLATQKVSTIATRFSYVYDYVFSLFPERIPDRWKKNHESRLLVNEYFF
jgi:hypothetical protein